MVLESTNIKNCSGKLPPKSIVCDSSPRIVTYRWILIVDGFLWSLWQGLKEWQSLWFNFSISSTLCYNSVTLDLDLCATSPAKTGDGEFGGMPWLTVYSGRSRARTQVSWLPVQHAIHQTQSCQLAWSMQGILCPWSLGTSPAPAFHGSIGWACSFRRFTSPPAGVSSCPFHPQG